MSKQAWRFVRWLIVVVPALREVPFLQWLQAHQCCICGKPSKRRWAHWSCERPLLGPLL